jgi:bud site selection protein 20
VEDFGWQRQQPRRNTNKSSESEQYGQTSFGGRTEVVISKDGYPTKVDKDKDKEKIEVCSLISVDKNHYLITIYRDLDQIHEDLRSPKHLAAHKASKSAEDLPGLGQFYCVECAKYFESEHSQVTHLKGSTHKRRFVFAIAVAHRSLLTFHSRLKALKEGPYTQKEAEAAIGLRTDNGPKVAALEKTKDMEVEMENLQVAT